MRTRLVRPEFWTDSVMADLTAPCRLTYIGLWCLADDAGFVKWDAREIAGELYRHEAPRRRDAAVRTHLDSLVATGRVRVLECGAHAVIPTLPDYRQKGGEMLYTVRKQHERRCPPPLVLRRAPSGSVSESVSVSVSESESVAPAGARFSDIVPPPPGYDKGNH